MQPTRLRLAAKGEKPNITGFDIRALRASTGQPRYDPWERAEAWRYQGQFTRFNRFKSAFPGLGIASVAFGIYCIYDYVTDDGHGHH
ncbi:NADH-ubiquinone oxidoreductase B12 subunit family-domain-containing protein [Plectosphaerella plurivora]|uniref:NADH-ubiquinone oxidoreductase B12 subunit family-domain-containing protein n=2 Tax=Plectosphaerella TaxID=40657 RepID=A0A9P8V4P2_9PEZI|nr:NADH-ubiquinone oxidoreductase B12 subunit family-domain-containing protein [Plectosphaerella plurivora]KAH7349419.1 NADH-ubiquinone oxidoreductase B12 subunit family-domain-containing protein [Plectosphaerella cucumerina]